MQVVSQGKRRHTLTGLLNKRMESLSQYMQHLLSLRIPEVLLFLRRPFERVPLPPKSRPPISRHSTKKVSYVPSLQTIPSKSSQSQSQDIATNVNSKRKKGIPPPPPKKGKRPPPPLPRMPPPPLSVGLGHMGPHPPQPPTPPTLISQSQMPITIVDKKVKAKPKRSFFSFFRRSKKKPPPPPPPKQPKVVQQPNIEPSFEFLKLKRHSRRTLSSPLSMAERPRARTIPRHTSVIVQPTRRGRRGFPMPPTKRGAISNKKNGRRSSHRRRSSIACVVANCPSNCSLTKQSKYHGYCSHHFHQFFTPTKGKPPPPLSPSKKGKHKFKQYGNPQLKTQLSLSKRQELAIIDEGLPNVEAHLKYVSLC